AGSGSCRTRNNVLAVVASVLTLRLKARNKIFWQSSRAEDSEQVFLAVARCGVLPRAPRPGPRLRTSCNGRYCNHLRFALALHESALATRTLGACGHWLASHGSHFAGARLGRLRAADHPAGGPPQGAPLT